MVGVEVEVVHLGVEGEDLGQGAAIGVSAKEGVVEERVWVGNCIEHLACVVDGRGKRGGEGEEFGGDGEVGGEAMGDEEGVDAFEGEERGAGV